MRCTSYANAVYEYCASIQYECVTCAAQLLLVVGGLFPISILCPNTGNKDPFTRYIMQFLHHEDEYLALHVSLGTERRCKCGITRTTLFSGDSKLCRILPHLRGAVEPAPGRI